MFITATCFESVMQVPPLVMSFSEVKKNYVYLYYFLISQGLDLGMPCDDKFMNDVMEVKQICTQWLNKTKQVKSEIEYEI
jgi:hypothetical protein